MSIPGRQRAFTLVEMVITLALSAILLVAIMQIYLVYGRVILTQEASITANLGANAVVEAVRRAGLQADHVVTSHSFSGVPYTSDATTVIFELPAIDASGNIIGNTYDYIAITASSTEAYRFTDAAAGSSRLSGTKRLTNALAALNFSYDAAPMAAVTAVMVDATTTASVKGESVYRHVSGHVYLRNI